LFSLFIKDNRILTNSIEIAKRDCKYLILKSITTVITNCMSRKMLAMIWFVSSANMRDCFEFVNAAAHQSGNKHVFIWTRQWKLPVWGSTNYYQILCDWIYASVVKVLGECLSIKSCHPLNKYFVCLKLFSLSFSIKFP